MNPFFAYFNENRENSDKTLFFPNLSTTKVYDRSASVSLPIPEPVAMSYSEQVKLRRSDREFTNTKLSLEKLSQILYWSLSPQAVIEGDGVNFARRPHPSGGAKFPIETYICTDQHEVLGTAMYHYRGDKHELEHLCDLSAKEVNEVKESYVYDFVLDIPVLCIFTYLQERNVPKYGAFGGKLALIEAGHIAQNFYLISAAQKTKAIALAGGGFSLLNSFIAVDGYNECAFYTVGLGSDM